MILPKILLIVVVIFIFCPVLEAQETAEKPVQVVTEEVRLNVLAQNDYGHFDPTLVKDDLLVTENNVPQNVESLRRAPASVLLLLDTGGELYFAKNTATTREAAREVVQNLSAEDALAIMQYNDKPQLVSDWSLNRSETALALNRKLSVGKRSGLAAALEAAAEMFKNRQPENRHLVLITDGLETIAAQSELEAAVTKILAANVSVHVISYTQLEEQQAQKLTQRVKLGKNIKPLRVIGMIAEILSPDIRDAQAREKIARKPAPQGGMTNDEIKDELRRITETETQKPAAKGGRVKLSGKEPEKVVVIETDNDWIEIIRKKREAWKTSEAFLRRLAEDTGGIFHTPESAETIQSFGKEVAAAIGSQYVLTYSPKRQIADSDANEVRNVRVVSRRVGLQIRARQKLVKLKSVE